MNKIHPNGNLLSETIIDRGDVKKALAESDYISEGDVNIIHTIFPYAEIHTIKDAGHWVHAEQPEALLKKVEEFILEV